MHTFILYKYWYIFILVDIYNWSILVHISIVLSYWYTCRYIYMLVYILVLIGPGTGV